MKARISMQAHWNHVYDSNATNRLSWYEAIPQKSLELITKCPLKKDDLILDVGTGASTLIDALLEEGYTNIVAADLSETALDKSKQRLGAEKTSNVKWIVDDITQSKHVAKLSDVSLWHDRAVLHFLTEEDQRQAYRQTLYRVVKQGGFAVIAAFARTGHKKCSGLDVFNYDEKMLSDFLGEDFELKESFEYTYHQPSGAPRPYIYTLFQRIQ